MHSPVSCAGVSRGCPPTGAEGLPSTTRNLRSLNIASTVTCSQSPRWRSGKGLHTWDSALSPTSPCPRDSRPGPQRHPVRAEPGLRFWLCVTLGKFHDLCFHFLISFQTKMMTVSTSHVAHSNNYRSISLSSSSLLSEAMRPWVHPFSILGLSVPL